LSGVTRSQSDQGFPSIARLRRPAEFKLALRSGRRTRGVWFTLATSASTTGRGRLGVIVPRRLVAKAVQRNRLKRIVRDVFRRISPPLPAVDVVIQMHAAPPVRGGSRALREELIRLLEWSRG
jgi:ribonuclease P protein component